MERQSLSFYWLGQVKQLCKHFTIPLTPNILTVRVTTYIPIGEYSVPPSPLLRSQQLRETFIKNPSQQGQFDPRKSGDVTMWHSVTVWQRDSVTLWTVLHCDSVTVWLGVREFPYDDEESIHNGDQTWA